MADTDNQSGSTGGGVPQVGTAEADAFVAALEARVLAAEEKIASEMVSTDEAESFCLKTGLSALTSQISKENGSDLVFTKPPAPKKKKKKKKRMRVSI